MTTLHDYITHTHTHIHTLTCTHIHTHTRAHIHTHLPNISRSGGWLAPSLAMVVVMVARAGGCMCW